MKHYQAQYIKKYKLMQNVPKRRIFKLRLIKTAVYIETSSMHVNKTDRSAKNKRFSINKLP